MSDHPSQPDDLVQITLLLKQSQALLQQNAELLSKISELLEKIDPNSSEPSDQQTSEEGDDQEFYMGL